jgi:thioredoxin reductase
VTLVERRDDGRFNLGTSAGKLFITKTIFIAGGVGSFQPRTLKVDGIEKFEGQQLFYRVKDPARFKGRNLVICGGGDSALDWALNLVGNAESVVLVHRRERFRLFRQRPASRALTSGATQTAGGSGSGPSPRRLVPAARNQCLQSADRPDANTA